MKLCADGIGDRAVLFYCSFVRNQTMHRSYEGHRDSPYLAKLEADRQSQHSGYGVQQYLCADGSQKWEAYSWERITELSIHTTSYGIFDHKWQAEQYFNNCIYG